LYIQTDDLLSARSVVEKSGLNFEFAPGLNGSSTWDEMKRLSNIAKHGIDFKDAMAALTEPHLQMSSNRQGEIRTLAICRHTLKVIAVVYTLRGDLVRIISARAARKHDKRDYENLFGQ
jgi:uncharacterized DUF497 family protein